MNQEDLLAIERRRQIAQALMEQGQEPIDANQVAGGYVVPVSPLQGLAKVAQSLAGAYIGKQADKQAAAVRQQQFDELSSIDFSSDDVANQLAKAGYVDEAVKMMADKAKAGIERQGTPGQWFIPAGATPFKDDQTGIVGYKTKEGDIIPSRAAMTDYQQAMVDPNVVAAVANAREGQKSQKFIDPETGSESYRSMTELNPSAYPQPSSPRQSNNFNFGNLRPPGASTGFQSFKTPEEGMQAFKNQLMRYLNRGIDTPQEIINTYSPSSENPTAALINNFVKRTGIAKDQVIDKNNPEMLDKLYKAMLIQEQGNKAQDIINKYLTPMQGRSAEATAAAKAEAELPVKLAEEQAKNNIKNAGEIATTKAKNDLEIQKTQDEKLAAIKYNAEQANPLIDKAMKLLPNTVSGGINAKMNDVMEAMNISTPRAQAKTQLDAIAADLTSKVPRAPGAQSDIELKYAQAQAGNLADSNKPWETRMAAAKYLKERNEKILKGEEVQPPKDDKEAKLAALRKKHGL